MMPMMLLAGVGVDGAEDSANSPCDDDGHSSTISLAMTNILIADDGATLFPPLPALRFAPPLYRVSRSPPPHAAVNRRPLSREEE